MPGDDQAGHAVAGVSLDVFGVISIDPQRVYSSAPGSLPISVTPTR